MRVNRMTSGARRSGGCFLRHIGAPTHTMSRVKLSLNGAWEFIPDPTDQFRTDSLPDRAGAIEVPGSWEGQFPADAEMFGRAWYRRRLEIPPDWQGQAVFLRFGAVNYYCQVWVNGAFL